MASARAVAEGRERFSNKLLAGVWSVHFGGIKKRRAFFMRLSDDRDALVSVCRRSIVGADAHAAGTEFRNFQCSEFSCFHFSGSFDSAVDDGQARLVVALTGGRREVVQPLDLLGAQLDTVGGGVFLDARDPLGAGNRRDVIALREQPGQRDLCRCCTRLAGNGLDFVDDAQIALEVLAGEARVRLAPVVASELLGRADLAGEETVTEWGVGSRE